MSLGDKGDKIVVFGEVLIDFFAQPADKPAPGTRRFGLTGVPGGAPANVAAHLAHEKVPVSLVTGFADDAFGSALQALLAERNIDLARSVLVPGTRTPLAVVQSSPDGERSFRLYLKGSVAEHVSPAALGPHGENLLQDARWLYFGSVFMAYESPYQVTRHLLEQAHQQQTLVLCDLNIRPDVWSEASVPTDVLWTMLPSIDLLKISDEDFTWFREHVAVRYAPELRDPADLLAWGPSFICWTHGPKGATLCTHTERVHIPAPQVDVVDTTGAGDAFTAGLLAALRQRRITDRTALAALGRATLTRVGAIASSRAASILTQQGAMPPL